MLKIEIIGNIGQDAVVKEINGIKKISFSVVSNKRVKRGDEYVERSTWVSCLASYHEGGNLCSNLRKGARVFVRGDIRVNVYDGKDGKMAGISCDVDHIEVVQWAKTDDVQF